MSNRQEMDFGDILKEVFEVARKISSFPGLVISVRVYNEPKFVILTMLRLIDNVVIDDSSAWRFDAAMKYGIFKEYRQQIYRYAGNID